MPVEKVDIHKHLDLVQNIVNRMAHCSFQLKGWSVTLVAALFALAAKDASGGYAFIPYIPVVTFWILDGYFVFQERLYRHLYDEVRVGRVSDFDLSTREYIGLERRWISALFSKTLLLFHGALLVTVVIVMFIFV